MKPKRSMGRKMDDRDHEVSESSNLCQRLTISHTHTHTHTHTHIHTQIQEHTQKSRGNLIQCSFRIGDPKILEAAIQNLISRLTWYP